MCAHVPFRRVEDSQSMCSQVSEDVLEQLSHSNNGSVLVVLSVSIHTVIVLSSELIQRSCILGTEKINILKFVQNLDSFCMCTGIHRQHDQFKRVVVRRLPVYINEFIWHEHCAQTSNILSISHLI